MEKNENKNDRQAAAVRTLCTSKELYVIISLCTSMPFVKCDPETYDDEIFLYENEEDVKREGKRFIDEKQPVRIAKVEKNQLLQFYTNLYTMGVNCIVLNAFTEKECRVQLSEMVKKPEKQNAAGQAWIENPELHLTALYFMQEIRRQKLTEIPDELKEMQNEILADYAKGTFLAVFNEEKKVPLLKLPNGDAYQPVFTDVIEMQKFTRGMKMSAAAIPATKIPTVLAPEAKGVVVNPGGINLQLPITRNGEKK